MAEDIPQHTISLMIRTADVAWTSAYANPGPGPGTAIVTILARAAERITFAGTGMIAFDLGQAAERLPADWPNQHAAVPLTYHVAGALPEPSASGHTAAYDRNRRAAALFAAEHAPEAEAQ
jgi:aspartate aminotransferase-like enzyme